MLQQFRGVRDTRESIDSFTRTFHEDRPHRSLGMLTPPNGRYSKPAMALNSPINQDLSLDICNGLRLSQLGSIDWSKWRIEFELWTFCLIGFKDISNLSQGNRQFVKKTVTIALQVSLVILTDKGDNSMDNKQKVVDIIDSLSAEDVKILIEKGALIVDYKEYVALIKLRMSVEKIRAEGHKASLSDLVSITLMPVEDFNSAAMKLRKTA